jgi:hypothetical protein
VIANVPGIATGDKEPRKSSSEDLRIRLSDALSLRDQHFIDQRRQTELLDLRFLHTFRAVRDDAELHSIRAKSRQRPRHIRKNLGKGMESFCVILSQIFGERVWQAEFPNETIVYKLPVRVTVSVQFKDAPEVDLVRNTR